MAMDFKDYRRLKPLTRFPLSSKETEFPAKEVFS
jgi:hypothetical protein